MQILKMFQVLLSKKSAYFKKILCETFRALLLIKKVSSEKNKTLCLLKTNRIHLKSNKNK